MNTEMFVRCMRQRPVRLTVLVPVLSNEPRGSQSHPIQLLMTDELDYALGYDPTIARAKRPIGIHRAPAPFGDGGNELYPTLELQRERLHELNQVCDTARTESLELRQVRARHASEVARLEMLVALGDDPTYCRNCDLRMLNLQTLLRALGRVSTAIFADFAHGTGDYEILAECSEALAGAAYLDTQIAELASYLAESLPQVSSDPFKAPRKLKDVLPKNMASQKFQRRISVKITIVGAQGLRKADWMRNSDPYCVCSIPGKSVQFQTPVLQNTANPTWNFTHELMDFTLGDSLQFSVRDSDLSADDSLGNVVLDYAQFSPRGFDGRLELQDTGQESSATLTLKIELKEE